MKTICIFLLATYSLSAQSFLIPGKQWVYEYNYYASGIGLIDQSIETITVGADTLINNLTYTTLTATENGVCAYFSTTEYLREEGSEVYRLSMDRSTEFLLFDFDETVGYDIFYEPDEPGEIDTAHAVIDSFGFELTYDGTPVEVQYMHIINNQSFGDDQEFKVNRHAGFLQYGLLFPAFGTGFCDFDEGIGYLRCLITAGDTIHFTSFDCFESSIINGVEGSINEEVIIFPNPSTDIVFIPDGYEITKIMDMHGRNQAIKRNSDNIDISGFSGGMYFVLLKGAMNNGMVVKRVIKL